MPLLDFNGWSSAMLDASAISVHLTSRATFNVIDLMGVGPVKEARALVKG